MHRRRAKVERLGKIHLIGVLINMSLYSVLNKSVAAVRRRCSPGRLTGGCMRAHNQDDRRNQESFIGL